MIRRILLLIVVAFACLGKLHAQADGAAVGVCSGSTMTLDPTYTAAYCGLTQNITSVVLPNGIGGARPFLLIIDQTGTCATTACTITGWPTTVTGAVPIMPFATSYLAGRWDPVHTKWVISSILQGAVFGTQINSLGNTTNLTSQTICAADSTCPAGQYQLSINVVVTQAATLGAITGVNVTYTDKAGSNTETVCPAVSLIGVGRCRANLTFMKTDNTPVTALTVVGSITGTPKYDVTATLTRLQ